MLSISNFQFAYTDFCGDQYQILCVICFKTISLHWLCHIPYKITALLLIGPQPAVSYKYTSSLRLWLLRLAYFSILYIFAKGFLTSGSFYAVLPGCSAVM